MSPASQRAISANIDGPQHRPLEGLDLRIGVAVDEVFGLLGGRPACFTATSTSGRETIGTPCSVPMRSAVDVSGYALVGADLVLETGGQPRQQDRSDQGRAQRRAEALGRALQPAGFAAAGIVDRGHHDVAEL